VGYRLGYSDLIGIGVVCILGWDADDSDPENSGGLMMRAWSRERAAGWL
jgi:hypothetical protein